MSTGNKSLTAAAEIEIDGIKVQIQGLQNTLASRMLDLAEARAQIELAARDPDYSVLSMPAHLSASSLEELKRDVERTLVVHDVLGSDAGERLIKVAGLADAYDLAAKVQASCKTPEPDAKAPAEPAHVESPESADVVRIASEVNQALGDGVVSPDDVQAVLSTAQDEDLRNAARLNSLVGAARDLLEDDILGLLGGAQGLVADSQAEQSVATDVTAPAITGEIADLSALWHSDPDVSDAFGTGARASGGCAHLTHTTSIAGDAAASIERAKTARRINDESAATRADVAATKAATGLYGGGDEAQAAMKALGHMIDQKMSVIRDQATYYVPQVTKGRDLFAWTRSNEVKQALISSLAVALRPIPGIKADVLDNDRVLMVITGPRFFLDPLVEAAGSPLRVLNGLPEFVEGKPTDPNVEQWVTSSLDNYKNKVVQAAEAAEVKAPTWSSASATGGQ